MLACAAVTRFARATGDLHSLSAVDTKLVALAYTLEAATYGTSHLRVRACCTASGPQTRCAGTQHKVAPKTVGCWLPHCSADHMHQHDILTFIQPQDLPTPPRARPRKRGPDAKRLPGWGMAGGKWTELDRLDEEAEAAAAAASGAQPADSGDGDEQPAGSDAQPAMPPAGAAQQNMLLAGSWAGAHSRQVAGVVHDLCLHDVFALTPLCWLL